MKWIASKGCAKSTGHGIAWRVGFLCLLLLPWMLVVSRTGAELCTALPCVLFLWHSYRQRDWGWLRLPWVRIAFITWLWLLLVVSPFALLPEKSFLAALPWIRYILLVVAMRQWLLRDLQSLRNMGLSLALLLGACCVDTVWQYMYHVSLTQHEIRIDNRLTGPFVAPKIGIFIAKLLLPAAAIGMVLALRNQRVAQGLVMVGIVLCTVVIFLSGERTAFIMITGTIVLIAGLLCYYRRTLVLPTLAIFGTLACVIFMLVQTQPSAQGSVERTVVHVEHFSSTPYGEVFRTAWQTGLDHWPTGVGVQGFRHITARLYEQPAADKPAINERYMHTHNPYLEWLVEAGLGGLLWFMLLVGGLVREAYVLLRRAGHTSIVIPAFMLGTWLINFFPVMSTQSYFSNWAGILAWFSLGLVYSLSNIFADTAATESTRPHV